MTDNQTKILFAVVDEIKSWRHSNRFENLPVCKSLIVDLCGEQFKAGRMQEDKARELGNHLAAIQEIIRKSKMTAEELHEAFPMPRGLAKQRGYAS
jgi:hypothetical protein